MSIGERLHDLITGEGVVKKSAQRLIEDATPMLCAEVLMRNIAGSIKDVLEAPHDETANEAVKRFRLGRDYVKVLDFMMAAAEKEIVPALGRLHEIQYGETAEINADGADRTLGR